MTISIFILTVYMTVTPVPGKPPLLSPVKTTVVSGSMETCLEEGRQQTAKKPIPKPETGMSLTYSCRPFEPVEQAASRAPV